MRTSLARLVAIAVVLASVACSDKAADTMKSTNGSGGSGANADGGSGAGSGGRMGSAGTGAANGSGGRASTAATDGMDGGASDDACGPVLRAPRCLQNEWCWDGPSFVGGDLYAIDGTRDAKSIWAVGELGSAFRDCGGKWLPIDTGVEDHLYDVFSPTVDFAVAVGEHGTVIVWDGATWKRVDMPTDKTLRAVWGASPSDIWIGCDLNGDSMADNLFHFDGSAISDTAATGSTIESIRGRSDDDIYAVGGADLWPYTVHYDGKTWTQTLLNADPDPGIVQQLVFATVKNRTFSLFDGVNSDQVFADDRPGWSSVYYPKTQLSALYLDDEDMPSVVSTLSPDDPLMPGVVIKATEKATDENWMMSDERFSAWPEEVWTGAGHDFAVGRGATLLTRGGDGVWSQVPDFTSMLGTPVAIGGRSADDAWFVSEHDVYHRDNSGWKSVQRFPEYIQSASVDLKGELYISVQGGKGTVRHYDGSTWHDLPDGKVSYGSVYAFASDDVWFVDQTSPAHFDGSAWTYISDLCDAAYGSDMTRFRRGPDGKVWGVNPIMAVQFSPTSKTCTQVIRADKDHVADDALLDVAWTDGGEMWGISRLGRLFHREGDSFVQAAMPAIDFIPDAGAPSGVGRRLIADTLFAMSGNKLRYALTDTAVYVAERGPLKGKLVTVDVTGGAIDPTIEDLPVIGPLWIAQGTTTFVALPGGVMRRDR